MSKLYWLENPLYRDVYILCVKEKQRYKEALEKIVELTDVEDDHEVYLANFAKTALNEDRG
jgi:hypothetical protein